ncbi:hypothetical protein BX616_002530, partial [Lobosporangium transversale]
NRPMSPIGTGIKLAEPPAIEGRWAFRTAQDFSAPPLPDFSQIRTYPSGNSSGTTIPLDLTTLAGITAGRMPPPPPAEAIGRYLFS